ncbi:hypothetical protein Ocin01_18722, partial [Orchesella cincta]
MIFELDDVWNLKSVYGCSTLHVGSAADFHPKSHRYQNNVSKWTESRSLQLHSDANLRRFVGSEVKNRWTTMSFDLQKSNKNSLL